MVFVLKKNEKNTPFRVQAIHIFFILFFLAFVGLGCGHSVKIESRRGEYSPTKPRGGPPPHAPAHGYRAKYRYYPDNQVYYDPNRSLYFYYSGGSWQMSVSLPTSIKLGDYVTIEIGSDKPYIYNKQHIQKYPPGLAKKKVNKGKGKYK